jgi:hypothetical protein
MYSIVQALLLPRHIMHMSFPFQALSPHPYSVVMLRYPSVLICWCHRQTSACLMKRPPLLEAKREQLKAGAFLTDLGARRSRFQKSIRALGSCGWTAATLLVECGQYPVLVE